MNTTAQATTSDVPPSVQECIDEANVEFCNDLKHHLDWLDKQRPGEAQRFMAQLTATYCMSAVPAEQSSTAMTQSH